MGVTRAQQKKTSWTEFPTANRKKIDPLLKRTYDEELVAYNNGKRKRSWLNPSDCGQMVTNHRLIGRESYTIS